jgi:RNA polymerase sigma factor (sigma-70 family)
MIIELKPTHPSDSELVAKSLAGDRDAFGEIVARYQNLVCAITYGATGSVAQSEDLAQETFLTAWQRLCALREPDKLRFWLSGIARNRIQKAREKHGREPSLAQGYLEDVEAVAAPAPDPRAQAITREEEVLLWQALKHVPENYREPLVLFYREGQSTERVAQALDLTEDAVRQRLSRGRTLLREQLLGLIEGALKRTSPGKAFTVGVLAALPAVGTTAKAATAAGTATMASLAGKSSSVAGAWLIAPLSAIFGAWLQIRLNDKFTRDAQQRKLGKRFALLLGANLLVFALLGELTRFINMSEHTALYITVFVSSIALPLFVAAALSAWFVLALRRLQREKREHGI